MERLAVLLILSLFASCALGATLWDGNFNSYAKNTDLDLWNWNNQNVHHFVSVVALINVLYFTGWRISDLYLWKQEYCQQDEHVCGFES
jgi:hypothetical protein